MVAVHVHWVRLPRMVFHDEANRGVAAVVVHARNLRKGVVAAYGVEEDWAVIVDAEGLPVDVPEEVGTVGCLVDDNVLSCAGVARRNGELRHSERERVLSILLVLCLLSLYACLHCRDLTFPQYVLSQPVTATVLGVSGASVEAP